MEPITQYDKGHKYIKNKDGYSHTSKVTGKAVQYPITNYNSLKSLKSFFGVK